MGAGQAVHGQSGRYRLTCDIGGTFTDFYLVDMETGSIDVEKCLTTPADPALGVLQGVQAREN